MAIIPIYLRSYYEKRPISKAQTSQCIKNPMTKLTFQFNKTAVFKEKNSNAWLFAKSKNLSN